MNDPRWKELQTRLKVKSVTSAYAARTMLIEEYLVSIKTPSLPSKTDSIAQHVCPACINMSSHAMKRSPPILDDQLSAKKADLLSKSKATEGRTYRSLMITSKKREVESEIHIAGFAAFVRGIVSIENSDHPKHPRAQRRLSLPFIWENSMGPRCDIWQVVRDESDLKNYRDQPQKSRIQRRLSVPNWESSTTRRSTRKLVLPDELGQVHNSKSDFQKSPIQRRLSSLWGSSSRLCSTRSLVVSDEFVDVSNEPSSVAQTSPQDLLLGNRHQTDPCVSSRNLDGSAHEIQTRNKTLSNHSSEQDKKDSDVLIKDSTTTSIKSGGPKMRRMLVQKRRSSTIHRRTFQCIPVEIESNDDVKLFTESDSALLVDFPPNCRRSRPRTLSMKLAEIGDCW